MGDLGDAYRLSGDKAKAKPAYDQAIALALKALRVNPQDAATLGDLAFYYAKSGDSKKGSSSSAARAASMPRTMSSCARKR